MGASKRRRGRPPLPLEGQRQRLLDAARQLLERGELETAGVRDIVAEAGMSSRAFYQVFESRDALILELAREIGGMFLERLEAVPDPSETLDTEQVADRLIDPYVEVAAPLIALDGARLPRSTADRLQEIRAELLEGSLDVMYEKFERAVRAGRLTALPDRTGFEIVLRGVESLTADLSRRGRLHELEALRASIRELLLAQVPLAPRPKRG
jgi:AcrR family transcriptional regulator